MPAIPPHKPIPPLSLRTYAALFGLALLVRTLLFLSGPWTDARRGFREDSARYLTLADNLRKYGAFGKQEEEGLAHVTMARLRAGNGTAARPDANGLLPEAFRTPAYPAFLAALGVVTADPRAALAVQCLLGASLACMVASIALAFGVPRKGAVLAGVLWALHPALVLFDLLIMTESLFNFCAVSAIFIAAHAHRAYGWAGSGLLVGLAGLVRPLGLLYLPFALLLALRRRQLRWATATLMIGTAALPSALWACRNWSVGEGLRVSTAGDFNLLYYTAGYTLSEEKGEDWLASWPDRVDELSQRLQHGLAPGQDVFAAGRGLAIEELKAHPAAAARMEAKSALKLFVDHSLLEFMQLLGRPYSPSGLFSRFILGESGHADVDYAALSAALLWSGLNVLVSVGSAVGMLRLLRRGQYSLALACGLLIGAFVVATMSVGLERMRLPMMPALFLLFASAFWPPERSPRAQHQPASPAGAPPSPTVPEAS